VLGIGDVINGKYRLIRLLGDGGMGSVYEAQHEALGTRVAIKLLHPELARRTGLVDRFLQEARVSAQIRSAHVVQVTDVDRVTQVSGHSSPLADGQAFLVMELLEGEPLSSVLDRQRKLPVPMSCEYAGQILEALEAAHALGVIHRDLKPENVFVTFLAGKPVLKLIDFGIAKLKRSDGQQRNLTVAGVVMGTAEYMAPEQARSADKVDARADLYAVGVMLYEMLAGVRPVAGEDARVIALKVERGEVQPLVQAAPEVPRELAGFVHRAMAARPELRFASAAEMRLGLEKVQSSRRGATNLLGAPAPAAAGGGARPATSPLAAAPVAAPMAIPLVLPVEELSATGTMKGAPARAVLAAAASRSQLGTQARAPAQSPAPAAGMQNPPPRGEGVRTAPGYVPVAVTPMLSGTTRRRRRSAVVWLVAVPLIVGAGVVVGVIAYSSQNGSAATPTPTPATTTQPTSSTAAATTTAAAPNDPLSPLNSTGPGPHTTPVHPSGTPTHPASPEDAGSLVIPNLFPDGGLFTIPTGFPSVLPLPTFTFPLPAPTVPPGPTPTPTHSSAPAPTTTPGF
jgi:tRNA A-37 threonylcarbamoyl transferase component Bud32